MAICLHTGSDIYCVIYRYPFNNKLLLNLHAQDNGGGLQYPDMQFYFKPNSQEVMALEAGGRHLVSGSLIQNILFLNFIK